MTVYRPKGSRLYLYDFVMHGQRYHGPTKCSTERDAKRVEAKIRAEAMLETGKRKKPPITLDEAAGLYEDYLRANNKWSATQDYIIASIIDGLGEDRYLSEIEQADLARHFAKRAGQVAASTVNREIEVARPIWRRVRKTHDIGEMPDWGALFYAVNEVDPRELHFDEEARLFAAIRKDHEDFVRFALLSGWRVSEVRGLRWSDVNLGQAIARTRIKGGNTVNRPLSDDMVVTIANQPKVGPFVFTYVCEKTRKAFVDKLGRKHLARLKGQRYPYSESGWNKVWKAALAEAGIENFTFHDLRHTRGTRILRQTGNLKAAMKALKHKSIKTTLRYAHAFDQDVRNALNASESRTIPETRNSDDEERRKSGES